MTIDPAIAELLKSASSLLMQRYEEVSNGFDSPPEPRTEWDFAAGMTAHDINQALKGFEHALLIAPEIRATRAENIAMNLQIELGKAEKQIRRMRDALERIVERSQELVELPVTDSASEFAAFAKEARSAIEGRP